MPKAKSDKRIKIKRVVVRVKDEMFDAFNEYIVKHDTTKTKIISDFLEDLLKEELKATKK